MNARELKGTARPRVDRLLRGRASAPEKLTVREARAQGIASPGIRPEDLRAVLTPHASLLDPSRVELGASDELRFPRRPAKAATAATFDRFLARAHGPDAGPKEARLADLLTGIAELSREIQARSQSHAFENR